MDGKIGTRSIRQLVGRRRHLHRIRRCRSYQPISPARATAGRAGAVYYHLVLSRWVRLSPPQPPPHCPHSSRPPAQPMGRSMAFRHRRDRPPQLQNGHLSELREHCCQRARLVYCWQLDWCPAKRRFVLPRHCLAVGRYRLGTARGWHHWRRQPGNNVRRVAVGFQPRHGRPTMTRRAIIADIFRIFAGRDPEYAQSDRYCRIFGCADCRPCGRGVREIVSNYCSVSCLFALCLLDLVCLLDFVCFGLVSSRPVSLIRHSFDLFAASGSLCPTAITGMPHTSARMSIFPYLLGRPTRPLPLSAFTNTRPTNLTLYGITNGLARHMDAPQKAIGVRHPHGPKPALPS